MSRGRGRGRGRRRRAVVLEVDGGVVCSVRARIRSSGIPEERAGFAAELKICRFASVGVVAKVGAINDPATNVGTEGVAVETRLFDHDHASVEGVVAATLVVGERLVERDDTNRVELGNRVKPLVDHVESGLGDFDRLVVGKGRGGVHDGVGHTNGFGGDVNGLANCLPRAGGANHQACDVQGDFKRCRNHVDDGTGTRGRARCASCAALMGVGGRTLGPAHGPNAILVRAALWKAPHATVVVDSEFKPFGTGLGDAFAAGLGGAPITLGSLLTPQVTSLGPTRAALLDTLELARFPTCGATAVANPRAVFLARRALRRLANAAGVGVFPAIVRRVRGQRGCHQQKKGGEGQGRSGRHRCLRAARSRIWKGAAWPRFRVQQTETRDFECDPGG